MKYYYIYKTTNLINGYIYVGQRQSKCFPEKDNNYIGSGIALGNAIKIHGKVNFKKEIIEICECRNIDDREIFWIAFYKATDRKIGYNLTDGGKTSRGYKHTEQWKLNKSIATKGKPQSQELIIKRTLKQRGKKLSEDTKEKISKNCIGRIPSSDTCEKIRKKALGRKASEDAKAAISAGLKGIKRSIITIELSKAAHSKFTYSIKGPDGSITSVNVLSDFAKLHSLDRATLSRTFTGYNSKGARVYHHKGFKIISRQPIVKTAA